MNAPHNAAAHGGAQGRFRSGARLALAVLLLGIACVMILHLQEPRYKGRPLSYWLAELSHDWTNAAPAIRAIGSKAVPHLSNDLRKRNGLISERFPDWFTPASVIRNRALNACCILGPDAKDAAPAIIDLLNGPGAEPYKAMETLRRVGTEPVPILAGLLAQRKTSEEKLPFLMLLSGESIGSLRKHGENLGPVLVDCLADPIWDVRNHAYAILCTLAPNNHNLAVLLRDLQQDKARLSAIGSDVDDTLWRIEKLLELQ